jgi:DNA-binding NarL/FixJ family response regulator
MGKLRTQAKILIVDDHPMVREGLAMRISMQPDLQVCGEAASEAEALTLVQETGPDLMIVDITLKSGHGLDVIKRVKAAYPDVKMLVLSGFQEAVYAERALQAGALGYLNKQESNDKVLSAIRTVLAGRPFVSQEITQRLVHQMLVRGDAAKTPVERLSNRELEVFRMIGQGQASGAIAKKLSVSTHTIDTHRQNIKRKLNLKNAAELTRAAVQWVLENG